MNARVHIIVVGMVQGVGFRYFVYKWATKLGTKGFVRNLPDGSVEVDAEGERSGLEALIAQIKVGPRLSQVTDLKIDWRAPDQSFDHFEIR